MTRAFPAVAAFAVLIVAALAGAPTSSAALLAAYDLAGEDPGGDSQNQEVPGASSGQFANTRTDIMSLEMADDGTHLHFKLNIAALPGGTGGYMYAVHFKVAGTSYLTCWIVQWTGGQSAANQEDLQGCQRFTGETRVGPATTTAGVHVAAAGGKTFVRWEVPKATIKNPGPGNPVTDIVADTWFRGVSNCCAGSSTTTQYLWNRADRGPNTGAWTYSLDPKLPDLALNLTADPANATLGPGSLAKFNLTLALAAGSEANVSLAVEGLPEGWNASFDRSNASLNETENHTVVVLEIQVPADAVNQTASFNVTATTPENVTASTLVAITVDTTVPATGIPGPEPTEAPANETAGPASEPASGGGIPGPGLGITFLAAMAGIAVWRRTRRDPSP